MKTVYAAGESSGEPGLLSNVSGAMKRLTLFLLWVTGAFWISEYLQRRRLVVVTYHRVIPRSCAGNEKRPPNTLFTDEFERQIAFLASRFRVLAGAQLRGVIEGSIRAPRYPLAITFDDGYENNYLYAWPILERYGLKAVFFVTTGFVGRTAPSFWFDRLDRLTSSVSWAEIGKYIDRWMGSASISSPSSIRRYFKSLPSGRQSEILDELEQAFGCTKESKEDQCIYGSMSWDQVRELVLAGNTIGSHTTSHQILAAVSPREVEGELGRSKERIEAETGESCWCFAYPNGARGDFRESDALALEKAGYECAFTQVSGALDASRSMYELPRVPIPDRGDMAVFRFHVSGLQRTLRHLLHRR